MIKHIHWTAEARADIRAIDRETAKHILDAIARFMKTESGDVKQLKGFHPPMFRLRIGAWRVTFHRQADNTIEAVRVRKRGEIYRR